MSEKNNNEIENLTPENYHNWFTLYHLCQLLGNRRTIEITSKELGRLMKISQQTASRRINDLVDLNWIKRKKIGKIQKIVITEKGANLMLSTYKNLRKLLESIFIVGEVTEGMKEGGYYVAIKGYYDQFVEKLGFKPYKGTLNLKLNDMDKEILSEKMKTINPVVIEGFKDQSREYGPVLCYDVIISPFHDRKDEVKAAILDIERTHHEKNIIEILAEPYLRDRFKLKNGDKVILTLNNPGELSKNY
ncbi:MAG: DUF120 domain-containing protein [Promethearchaeota archaeon]